MLKRLYLGMLAVLLLVATCTQPATPTATSPKATSGPTAVPPTVTPQPQPTEASAPDADTVNVVDAAALRDTVRIEIVPLASLGAGPLPDPAIVSEPSPLTQTVAELDNELPLR